MSMCSSSQPTWGRRQSQLLSQLWREGWDYAGLPRVWCALMSQILAHWQGQKALQSKGVLAWRHTVVSCPRLALECYLNSVLSGNVAFANDYFARRRVPCSPLHFMVLHFSDNFYPFKEHTSSWGWTKSPPYTCICLTLLTAPCTPRACCLHPSTELSQSHMLLAPWLAKKLWVVALAEQDLLKERLKPSKAQQLSSYPCLSVEGWMQARACAAEELNPAALPCAGLCVQLCCKPNVCSDNTELMGFMGLQRWAFGLRCKFNKWGGGKYLPTYINIYLYIYMYFLFGFHSCLSQTS